MFSLLVFLTQYKRSTKKTLVLFLHTTTVRGYGEKNGAKDVKLVRERGRKEVLHHVAG